MFWCSMSFFCFQEALAYLGLELRATFQKEINKQEAEIEKKKIKGKAQKAFMKCGSRHKKARSRKLLNFHLRVERWGTFKIKYFKPKQSSVLVSKAKNWTENHRKDQNLYSRNAEVVHGGASSFCLPNKNRVGVAHGDGTNLEVVYKDVTCVLFFILPLMKPHKVWGETFGDQKRYRLVCWDCMQTKPIYPAYLLFSFFVFARQNKKNSKYGQNFKGNRNWFSENSGPDYSWSGKKFKSDTWFVREISSWILRSSEKWESFRITRYQELISQKQITWLAFVSLQEKSGPEFS